MKKLQSKVALAIAMAGAALATSASAQSVDSLLDKLVDKGVLSVQEAQDLRTESDKDFNRAYAAKSGMSDWVSALRFNGDVRGRYESFYFGNDAGVDRHRFRYRLRFGVVANLFDNMEVGLRLTSSEAASGGGSGGDPISGNTTFQDNGSKKFVYIDLAYAKWNALNNANWGLTTIIGKMENPFVFSDMVFDGDYTPEVAAFQLAHHFNSLHSLRLNGGVFALDEMGASSRDPYLAGGQLRFDSKWNAKWASTFGVAWLALANEQTLNAQRSAGFPATGGTTPGGVSTWTVPNQNAGNLRTGLTGTTGTGGNLLSNFKPIIVDGAVTYTLESFWGYKALFPIRLAGEYMHNPGADSHNDAWSAGVTFGKAGKKGLWEISYRYKYLEGDAWFEELVDSDFGAYYPAGSPRAPGVTGYAAGTNIKGHIVKASYSPFDSLTLGITAFITELIQHTPGVDTASTRLQMDAVWKF